MVILKLKWSLLIFWNMILGWYVLSQMFSLYCSIWTENFLYDSFLTTQTIPVKYHGVLEDYGHCENLDIRHGDSRWKVMLKKRSKRAELHSGWNVLSKDLELKVGDVCFFRRAGSNSKFFLDVYKSCLWILMCYADYSGCLNALLKHFLSYFYWILWMVWYLCQNCFHDSNDMF